MPNFNLTDPSGLRCIVGHIGKEPQLNNTTSGKRVARFTVATNFKDKAGNVDTTWHTVTCWEDEADAAMQLHKGQVVCVVGKESQREYNGKTYTDLSAWFIGVGFPPAHRQSGHERLPGPGSNQPPVSE